jgi:hypothetical protein
VETPLPCSTDTWRPTTAPVVGRVKSQNGFCFGVMYLKDSSGEVVVAGFVCACWVVVPASRVPCVTNPLHTHSYKAKQPYRHTAT